MNYQTENLRQIYNTGMPNATPIAPVVTPPSAAPESVPTTNTQVVTQTPTVPETIQTPVEQEVAPAPTETIEEIPVQPQEQIAPQPTGTAGGTTGSSTRMSVNIDGVKANKKALEDAANELGKIWTTIEADVEHIDEAWAGKDAQMYKDKIHTMRNKINKTIEALNIISRTYQSAINEIENNQDAVKNDLL